MEHRSESTRRGLQDTRGPGTNDTWSAATPLRTGVEDSAGETARMDTRSHRSSHNELDERALIEELDAENTELRRQVAELQQRLEAGAAGGGELTEQMWLERQREYETLLEEKSEVIRSLHQKMQELTAASAAPIARPASAPAITPKEEELVALSEALELERQQLREDEEALNTQMREMELQMSRERAELARQRHEMQRIQAEIERELENAARDAILRERLTPASRRYHEMTNRRVGDLDPAAPPQHSSESAPASPPPQKSKDSGLLRRLFGG